LGFLVADGYVYPSGFLTITTTEKDKEHLIELGNLIRCEVKSSIRQTNYLKLPTKYYVLQCAGQKFGKKLYELFYSNGKQKTYHPPDLHFLKTPEQFLSFFIGFFDGDGCVDSRKNGQVKGLQIEIHSNWLDKLNGFQQILEDLGIRSRVRISSRKFALMRINHYDDIVKIKKFAITHRLPILGRKWNKINEKKERIPYKSDKHLSQIIDLLEKGISIRQIAKQFDVCAPTIYSILKRHGLQLKQFYTP
jgi:hypothetical protein